MESTIAGDGCFQNFKTAQSPTVWNTGTWNQNGFGIRHGSSGLWIYDTGNTTIRGNSDVLGLRISNTSARAVEINNTMHNGTYLVAISQNYSNHNLSFALRCRPLNQLWCLCYHKQPIHYKS